MCQYLMRAVCVCLLAGLFPPMLRPQRIGDPPTARQKAALWSLLKTSPAFHGAAAGKLTDDQQKTLDSIRKVSDYPIYVMTYHGDYGFDDYLETGRTGDMISSGFGEECSCIGALNPSGNKIYGRNLDLTSYYPILVTYTDPPNGYASVSLNIAIDIELYLDDPSSEQNIQWVLEYPYLTFDGMNEYGVAISGLNVAGEVVSDPGKISLGRYEVRRLVLDYARNLGEAVALIRRFNNVDSDGVHYLVSDAHGKSAVVEYFDGDVQVSRNVEPWQAVTNFMIRHAPPESLLGNCPRYATVYQSLLSHQGLISRWTGMNILSQVARRLTPVGDGRFAHTVWSAIYDLTGGRLNIGPGEQYHNLSSFELDMINDLAAAKVSVSPSRLEAGDAFTAKLQVRNLSPRPSKKTEIRFYLSKKKKLDGGAVLIGSRKLATLASRKKKTLQVKRTFGGAVPPGKYFFLALVDPEGDNNDPALKNNVRAAQRKIEIF